MPVHAQIIAQYLFVHYHRTQPLLALLGFRNLLMRAGIELNYKGTHIFRHILANNLLQTSTSLSETGQLLRHKSHDTTPI